MKKLSQTDLMSVEGGVSAWIVGGVVAAIVLIAGIIDGFTRPLKCNE